MDFARRLCSLLGLLDCSITPAGCLWVPNEDEPRYLFKDTQFALLILAPLVSQLFDFAEPRYLFAIEQSGHFNEPVEEVSWGKSDDRSGALVKLRDWISTVTVSGLASHRLCWLRQLHHMVHRNFGMPYVFACLPFEVATFFALHLALAPDTADTADVQESLVDSKLLKSIQQLTQPFSQIIDMTSSCITSICDNLREMGFAFNLLASDCWIILPNLSSCLVWALPCNAEEAQHFGNAALFLRSSGNDDLASRLVHLPLPWKAFKSTLAQILREAQRSNLGHRSDRLLVSVLQHLVDPVDALLAEQPAKQNPYERDGPGPRSNRSPGLGSFLGRDVENCQGLLNQCSQYVLSCNFSWNP